MKWNNMERHDIVRFIALFCLVFIIASMFNPPSRASILMWFSAEKADGIITRAADPRNHNYLAYNYTVRGKTYTGMGYAPNHQPMAEGQAVVVYIFPLLPSNSVLAGKDEQRKLAIFGLIVGLLFGVFVGFGGYWKRHRSSASRLRGQQSGLRLTQARASTPRPALMRQVLKPR
jgi:hypothetical protein